MKNKKMALGSQGEVFQTLFPTQDARTSDRIEVICFQHISQEKHTCVPKLSGIPL